MQIYFDNIKKKLNNIAYKLIFARFENLKCLTQICNNNKKEKSI